MFASIESVKAVSDVYSPVSGTVLEVNEKLESAPELLNENAMENWMAKIEFTDAGDLNALLGETE
jgi:glycine cleavage system H protein